MRLSLHLIIILAAIAVSVAIYFATGGRFIFFALPLLLGLPLLGRGRRRDEEVSRPLGEGRDRRTTR
jgi:hypothetical protein